MSLFLGRLHPVLVHLPIGLLIAAAGFQAWVAWRRRRGSTSTLEAAVGPLLWLSALGAVVSAGAGFLLGSTGAYGGDTFDRHQWLGFGVAVLAVLTVAARWHAGRKADRNAQVTYQVLLVASLVVLVGASHLGATLTHGEGYLTEHAPGPVKWVLNLLEPRPDEPQVDEPPGQAVVYQALVAPVFETRCVTCHGAERTEGGLRLDHPEGITAGGDHGAVVSPERPGSSELWRRVSLPSTHADVMPPSGRPPVTAAEGALINWWIAGGASFDETLGEAEVGPEVRPVVEALLGPLPPGGPTLPPVSPGQADPEALEAAQEAGFSVKPVAEGLDYVQVQTTNARGSIGDDEVALLAGLGSQVLWLDLAGTSVSDAALETIGGLPHVVRLNLSRTAVTGEGLAHLSGMEYLESLNLYGTAVGDDGLEHLQALSRLRSLYLWQTEVTPSAAEALGSRLPDLEVDTGGGFEASPEA